MQSTVDTVNAATLAAFLGVPQGDVREALARLRVADGAALDWQAAARLLVDLGEGGRPAVRARARAALERLAAGMPLADVFAVPA